ncbi:TetR/AcrR family transcriptional regulator [Sporichthya sp.]|uniref:TetR/AcrR family transcriptional regulator n=1 Tax=Sporichthya sp. TaxID=65475 RepID=UPI0017CB9313|nr:TetR/AcrR family transcriptional regulator [Sporichthya sp.]MBA3744083.1 TetR/AcrR family transcriptional regulator [Sporichthya sp.]
MVKNAAVAPKRTRVNGADRRELILKAARKVFIESGFSGARTNRIAELAGTSEAMLYRHFSSKEELFESAILEPVEKLVSELTESAGSMASLSDRDSRREASYEVNADVLAQMREVAPLLGVALFSDRAAGAKFYKKRLEPLLHGLSDSLASALEGWPHRPVTPELIIAMQLGTYNWIAMNEYFGSRKPDGDAISQQLTDLLVRAL